jgi:hypothetical protein
MLDTTVMETAGVHPHPDQTETDAHAMGTELAHVAHGDHGDPGAHGAGDGHGHGTPSEPLGPVDTRAWAAAIGGAALGIVVILALYLSLQS